jgi:uncharacterized SAM-binding protein YcdF (DUF218 family)
MIKRILKICIMILAVAGVVWFVGPFYWHVKNIGNIMGIVVCVLVFLVTAFSKPIGKKCKSSKPFRVFCRTVSVLFCIGLLWAAVLTGCMVYGANNFGAPAQAKDATVVVLGSQVTGTAPSADLLARINTAAAYLKANPQAKCIVSGGKGPGELVSEASVMREYLIKDGIDASRIFTEDRSKNTVENLNNSLAIIEKNGFSHDLAIVTDEYHQFRAGKTAASLGADATYAVCAPTPWYIFSACYARELLALTNFLIFP